MLLESLVNSSRHNDRCTHGTVVKLQISCCSPFSVVTKQSDPAAAACVLPASLSSAHHWSQRRGLGRALSFRSHDFLHYVLLGQILHLHTRRRQCIHPQNWYWPRVTVNWQLFFAGVVALVHRAESLKKFQAHFEVHHRLRLNPWACASWPSANHSFASLLPWFSSPSVSVDFVPVDFLFSVATLNGHSRDSVVPRLLTPHPLSVRPEHGLSAVPELPYQGTCSGLPRESSRSTGVDRGHCTKERSTV